MRTPKVPFYLRKELPSTEGGEENSSGVRLQDFPLLGTLSAMDVLHHLINKGPPSSIPSPLFALCNLNLFTVDLAVYVPMYLVSITISLI